MFLHPLNIVSMSSITGHCSYAVVEETKVNLLGRSIHDYQTTTEVQGPDSLLQEARKRVTNIISSDGRIVTYMDSWRILSILARLGYRVVGQSGGVARIEPYGYEKTTVWTLAHGL